MSDGLPGPDAPARRWITALLAVAFVVGWVVLMFVIPPEELVARIGVEQAYLVLFLLSVIGALLSMTTFSAYPALVTFAVGGMNLVALTVIAAVGLTLGDWLFYALVTRVKGLLGGTPREKAIQLEGWLEARPHWQVAVVTYLWVGVLPIANNILTGALALGGYRFRRIVPAIFLGNATFPAIVALLAVMGVEIYD